MRDFRDIDVLSCSPHLQITMADGVRMAEVECRDYLAEEPSGFLGRQTTFFNQIIEEFTAGYVL